MKKGVHGTVAFSNIVKRWNPSQLYSTRTNSAKQGSLHAKFSTWRNFNVTPTPPTPPHDVICAKKDLALRAHMEHQIGQIVVTCRLQESRPWSFYPAWTVYVKYHACVRKMMRCLWAWVLCEMRVSHAMRDSWEPCLNMYNDTGSNCNCNCNLDTPTRGAREDIQYMHILEERGREWVQTVEIQ